MFLLLTERRGLGRGAGPRWVVAGKDFHPKREASEAPTKGIFPEGVGEWPFPGGEAVGRNRKS